MSVEIEITRRGVYRGAEMLPVGTRLTLDKEPTGWVNKYRVINERGGRSMEVATPEPDYPEGGFLGESEREEIDHAELRAEYERATGKRPHHKMKPETMRRHIEEATDGGDDHNS